MDIYMLAYQQIPSRYKGLVFNAQQEKAEYLNFSKIRKTSSG